MILNSREYLVRRDLRNCYKMHQTIMSLFPQSHSKRNLSSSNTSARAEFNILYRIGFNSRNNQIKVLIQSKIKPDRSKLSDEYLLELESKQFRIKEIKDIESKIITEAKYMFKLRANPTKKSIMTPDGKKRVKGKRIFLKNTKDREQWLERRSIENGFEILNIEQMRLPEFIITDDGKQHGWKDKDHIQIRGVEFNGILRITDKELFATALKNGIGRAKTFGFGLLSIAPIKTL